MIMKKDKTAKEQIMTRMSNVLKGQAMFIREDNTITDVERLEQIDVILDLMKFLKDYDENIIVLNKYWQEKHKKEKQLQSEPEL